MSTFSDKIKKAIKNPLLIIKYLDELFNEMKKKKYKWSDSKKSKIYKKSYDSYDEYLKHQKSKLKKIENTKIPNYDLRYRKTLKNRLVEDKLIKPNMNILCLAARVGTEVKSFIDIGCFAVGIDLEPGRENKYVVFGDFHDLQFANESVDIIFSNSLDHTFDFKKLISEIKRVLKTNGLLIIEFVRGSEEGFKPGYYEASIWKKVSDIVSIFEREGFKIILQKNISDPWDGIHIIFSKE